MSGNDKLSNNKGFTLIELLIVLAVIGILATIAIPQFMQYKQRSYDSTSKVELRHLFVACQAYWGDTRSSNNCSLNIITQASYGFIPSTKVSLSINNGVELNFEAEASHDVSANTFKINPNGNISLK